MIIEGTNDNFKKEVLKSDKPVLVDFNATWCPPCQAMHPIVEELSDNYKVVAVDIDDQEELAEQYEVSGIPCFVVFKDGEEIDRRVGMQSKKRLIKMLEQ
jgi:thioredoxin